MEDSETFTTFRYSNWSSLVEHYRENYSREHRWMFRGQMDSKWPIKSSLERAAIDRFDICPKDIPRIEEGLIRQFKRQSYQYVKDIPVDHIEWLALMQHHGAPTRLIDWTYSFYIAAFFALESALSDSTCAIWAFYYDHWQKRAQEIVSSASEPISIDTILDSQPLVYGFSPFRLNQRLTIQQGTFLAQSDITKPFLKNMGAMMRDPKENKYLCKIEIKCNPQLIREALKDFHRMNISHGTLFPGLDGFARSLTHRIANQRLLPNGSIKTGKG